MSPVAPGGDAAIRSLEVPVDGGTLHAVESGSGPVAVLVHGFTMDHRLWLAWLPRLEGRRCVADAGHTLPLEAPETVAQYLLRLWKRSRFT